jgi:hypothetical protein
VRRELQQLATIDGQPGVLDAGLYRPEKVATVYRDVIRRARLSLTGGRPAILDGTWRDPHQRHLVHALATQTASTWLEILCATSVDTAVERVRGRTAGASEVTPQIARAVAIRDDTWDTAYPIDTSQALREATDEVEKLWHNVR